MLHLVEALRAAVELAQVSVLLINSAACHLGGRQPAADSVGPAHGRGGGRRSADSVGPALGRGGGRRSTDRATAIGQFL